MKFKGSKMKFKGKAIPQPSEGLVITEVDQVVPDQSLSLKEILKRFVRHEALPIGNNASFGNGQDPEGDSPLNIDLEKAAHWDLVERQEFKQKVEDMQRQYESQEKSKREKAHAEKVAKDKAEIESRIQAEVEKRTKNRPADAGSI